jgi:hypothetical protein
MCRLFYAPKRGHLSRTIVSSTQTIVNIPSTVNCGGNLLLYLSGIYILVQNRYLFPPSYENDIFSPLSTHHFSTPIVAFLPKSTLLCIRFSLFSFSSPFFHFLSLSSSFFPLSSLFFYIFPLFLFNFLYFFLK